MRDEEGWTQERIAQAKGIGKSLVSERLRYHTLPSSVKREVLMGTLAEGHLQTISGLVLKSELLPWLTTEQAWEELAAQAVHDKAKNGSKSVAAVRQDVDLWREFIDYATKVHAS